MPPFAEETEAVLPESGEPKAMPPVARENEAVLPDSREPKAMSPIAGETQAMSPVVKPKPLPDSLTLSCKTPPQPATLPPQSSNVEKLKLPSPTLLIEQEPWDPPDMLVLSNKLPPQPATHGQPNPREEEELVIADFVFSAGTGKPGSDIADIGDITNIPNSGAVNPIAGA